MLPGAESSPILPRWLHRISRGDLNLRVINLRAIEGEFKFRERIIKLRSETDRNFAIGVKGSRRTICRANLRDTGRATNKRTYSTERPRRNSPRCPGRLTA